MGRTARAGKEGVAVSLCEEKQVKNFLKMVKDAGIEGVEELSNSDEKLESLGDKFAECLEVVKEMLEKEKEGKEEKKGGKRGKHSVMSSSLVNIFLGFLKNLFIIPELKASQKVKMPKPKNKKAAFKKHAVSFQLIHRSQHVSGRRLVRVAELTFNFQDPWLQMLTLTRWSSSPS